MPVSRSPRPPAPLCEPERIWVRRTRSCPFPASPSPEPEACRSDAYEARAPDASSHAAKRHKAHVSFWLNPHDLPSPRPTRPAAARVKDRLDASVRGTVRAKLPLSHQTQPPLPLGLSFSPRPMHMPEMVQEADIIRWFNTRLEHAQHDVFAVNGALQPRLRHGDKEHFITTPLYPTGHQSLIHVGLTLPSNRSPGNKRSGLYERAVWKVYDRAPARSGAPASGRSRAERKGVSLGAIANESYWSVAMRSPFAPCLSLATADRIWVQHPVARGDLRFYLDAQGPNRDLAIRLLLQLLPQMHYAHEIKKVRHNDIKEKNIFVDDSFNLWLADWGSASQGTPSTGTLKNMRLEYYHPTKAYSTRAADMWALGKVLVATLLGTGAEHDPFDLPYRVDTHHAEAGLHNQRLARAAHATWEDAHAAYEAWILACRKARLAGSPRPELPTVHQMPGLNLNAVFGNPALHENHDRWMMVLMALFHPNPRKVNGADMLFYKTQEWWHSYADSTLVVPGSSTKPEDRAAQLPSLSDDVKNRREALKRRLNNKLAQISSPAHRWCTDTALVSMGTILEDVADASASGSLEWPSPMFLDYGRSRRDSGPSAGSKSPDKLPELLHPKPRVAKDAR